MDNKAHKINNKYSKGATIIILSDNRATLKGLQALRDRLKTCLELAKCPKNKLINLKNRTYK